MSISAKAKQAMPVLMGAGMGLMMLWMLHGVLVDGNWVSGWALAVFIGAHVVVAALALATALFAARLSPGMRARLARLHRPSWRHVGVMLASAAATAGLVHLIHGGIA